MLKLLLAPNHAHSHLCMPLLMSDHDCSALHLLSSLCVWALVKLSLELPNYITTHQWVVPCDHYPWSIGPLCTGPPSPGPGPSSVDMRHWTPSPPKTPWPLLMTSGGNHWWPVQTCSLEDPLPHQYQWQIQDFPKGVCQLPKVLLFFFFLLKTEWKQECIPVGCVPTMCLPYTGICFWGVPAWSWGYLPDPGGCTCLVPRGVYLPGPGGL